MSKGLGKWQRHLLAALAADTFTFHRLAGSTRSETAAIHRAARTLQRQGRLVIVRLWNDDHTAVVSYATRPGATLKDGRPVECLNVARVTRVTGATFTGSVRDLAATERVSATQVWRDLRNAAGIGRNDR